MTSTPDPAATAHVKPAGDLRPGDQIATVRTVTQVVHTTERVDVSFDDGTTQSFDLAGDPAVEVIATKETA